MYASTSQSVTSNCVCCSTCIQSRSQNLGSFAATVYECKLGEKVFAAVKSPNPVIRYHLLCPTFTDLTDEENFTSVWKNPAVTETDFNQYFENEGRSTYL